MTPKFIIFVLFQFAVALACLFFPKVVQSVGVKAMNMGITSRIKGLVAFVNSKQYLTVVRAVGVIALVVALFLSIAWFKGS